MPQSCNELENPIGIETLHSSPGFMQPGRCNELENPIGIETHFDLNSKNYLYSLQRT